MIAKGWFALAAAIVSSTPAFAENDLSPSVQQQLTNIAPYWRDETDKKTREASFDNHLSALSAMARTTSAHLCGRYVRQYGDPLGAIIALRAPANRDPKELLPVFQGGNALWVSPQTKFAVKPGDFIIQYRHERMISTKPKLRWKKVKNPKNNYKTEPVSRITGIAEVDQILMSEEGRKYGWAKLSDGRIEFIDVYSESKNSLLTVSCNGYFGARNDFWSMSLRSSLFGSVGLDKELFDNENNRYYPGITINGGRVNFHKSVADNFTDDELKWMVADMLGYEIAAKFPGFFTSVGFSPATEKIVESFGQKEGISEAKSKEVFRTEKRQFGMFLALYVGRNAGWKFDDYLAFLDSREKELHGSVDKDYSKLRRDILTYWYQRMPDADPTSGKWSPDYALAVEQMNAAGGS